VQNPVRFIDPDGRSTDVVQNEDGTYKVIGGNISDEDNGIYLRNKDGSRGNKIAYSATPESFYNCEEERFMGTINSNDMSGKNFLNNDIIKGNLSVPEYMVNATGGQQYDFKSTNGTKEKIYTNAEDFYRGMPIGKEDNLPVWVSARDIGNIAAGYVAGINGLSWAEARLGFDVLESWQKSALATEGTCTQYAERLGFNIGSTMHYNSQISELSRLPSYGKDILRNLKPVPKRIITKM
jgi:hypothetical protein